MRTFLVLAAFALASCSKPAPSPADASPAEAAAVKESAPTATTYRFSGFALGDGVLETCEDTEETHQHALDGGRDQAFPPSARKGLTEIESTCAEQFAGRVALASCTIEREVDGGTKRRYRQSFYSTTLIGDSDTLMQACLTNRGKWASVARDSLEWSMARAEEVRRKHKK